MIGLFSFLCMNFFLVFLLMIRQNILITYNFSLQAQAPVDDWGDDDDFADLDLDNDDFNTAMDAFENSSPPMEDKEKNEPKISDEELQVCL